MHDSMIGFMLGAVYTVPGICIREWRLESEDGKFSLCDDDPGSLSQHLIVLQSVLFLTVFIESNPTSREHILSGYRVAFQGKYTIR